MKNIQISFDEDIFAEIEHAVSATGLSFPDIVKDAVRQWLQKREIRKFENEWIEKLKQSPDDSQGAEEWMSIQHWSDNEPW